MRKMAIFIFILFFWLFMGKSLYEFGVYFCSPNENKQHFRAESQIIISNKINSSQKLFIFNITNQQQSSHVISESSPLSILPQYLYPAPSPANTQNPAFPSLLSFSVYCISTIHLSKTASPTGTRLCRIAASTVKISLLN
jgi:hypothetical protein